MEYRKIADNPETWALIFNKGDEFTGKMLDFAKEVDADAAHFTAIGAFESVVLGYFDRARKDYKRNTVEEQVEVVSLIGDIAKEGDQPKVHTHVVVGKSDGTALGGHLLEARVWPTLEVIVTESPAHLRRTHDEETGLALIDLEASSTVTQGGKG